MAIETEEVRHIAKLARLRFTETEEAAFAETLSQILNYVEQLQTVDTSDVEPTTHAVALDMHFRPDVVGPVLGREAALQNAPATVDGQFSVPKIVEGS